MDVRISPAPLSGIITAPPSKSYSHRAILCAALSDRPTGIRMRAPLCGDILETMDAAKLLGAEIRHGKNDVFEISPMEKGRRESFPVFDIKESGTTLRFLLPLCAVLLKGARFSAGKALSRRPILPLVSEMERHGCAFSSKSLPFDISGSLSSGRFRIPGDVSSQFVSALLLALPLLSGDSVIELTSDLVSAPYVGMTVDMMKKFGVSVRCENHAFFIPGSQKYISPGVIDIEGDFSGVSPFLVSGAMGGGDVSVRALSPRSIQGDGRILGILGACEATVSSGDGLVSVKGGGALSPIRADLSDTPDIFPCLAVLSCAISGESAFYGVGRLKYKESDRALSTMAMIRALSGNCRMEDDAFFVSGGGKLSGGIIDSAGDHRIAMAAAAASSICENDVIIKGAQCVFKSYPDFFKDFKLLGGECDVL